MKGMIFSITAGQGHNQTAKVLSDYFNENGVECSYMDVYKYINPLLSDSVANIYLMSTKNLPKIYGKFYRMFETKGQDGPHSLPKITNNLLAGKLETLINEEEPNFIICTHVFAAQLLTCLKGKIDKNIKTFGIITDFCVHPYWEDTDIDFYITPDEHLTNQAVKRGLPAEKFLPIGIPISTKFEKNIPREEALSQLGLPDKKTVLIMSGSMGFGDLTDEIKALDTLDLDFQMITVCGNNKKLKEEIDKLDTEKEIFNFGYVNNVDIMMDAADCIITKPGGLTTSEALAKGLPMIMNNPVPGQEDRNVEFLLNAGAALKVSETYPVDDAVNQLFREERMASIRKTIDYLGKPYATRDLANFVMDEVRGRIYVEG